MTHFCVWHDSFLSVKWLISNVTWLNLGVPIFAAKSDVQVCCINTGHDSFLCEKWPIPTCDMTHFYVWYVSFLSVTWLISYVKWLNLEVLPIFSAKSVVHVCCIATGQDSFLCEKWPIPMCDMTRFYVWHDSFLSVTWLISYVTWLNPQSNADFCCKVSCTGVLHHYGTWLILIWEWLIPMWHGSFLRDRIHSCVTWQIYTWHQRDSVVCVTWIVRTCDVPHAYVWHDSFVCVIWLTHMCDMT